MGMEDVPFYKRLLDDLAKPRPDLAYKFKTPNQAAAQVQPGSPAAFEAQAASGGDPLEGAFNQENVIPARPVNPFEVRIMFDSDGNPTSIRCYKGVIADYSTGKTGANSQIAIPVVKRTSKRVRISVGGGSAGIVGSDQKDFVPSNWDPGPEQFKYSEYENPTQTTFVPNFTGYATSGGVSNQPDKDPVPDVTTQAVGTGGYPYGKDTFNVNEQIGAYFEWPYSNGAMIRLFCKDASDPSKRAWGVWGNSGSPTSLGDDGFFILIAQIVGTRVAQLFASDIVAIGGGANVHPFKVRRNGTVGDDIVYQIEPGTINNKEVGNISDTFILDDGELVWLQLTVGGAASNYEFPTSIAVQNGTVMPPDTDEHAYIKVAKRSGATIQQFITGSLWSDRIRLGSMTSKYYYARI
jgi:hypothetical protein